MKIDMKIDKGMVSLESSGFNTETVRYNGDVVSKKNSSSMKASHCFQVMEDGKQVEYQLNANIGFGGSIACTLKRDGEEIYNQRHSVLGGGKAGFGFGILKEIPRWAWPFVALCAAIPLITLGGAIPTVGGLIGVLSCAGIAKRSSWSLVVRLLLCGLVTLGCWFLTFLTIGLLSS